MFNRGVCNHTTMLSVESLTHAGKNHTQQHYEYLFLNIYNSNKEVGLTC